MTEQMLEQIEAKMLSLIAELSATRKIAHELRQENAALRAEQGNYAKKLQGLISLLDSLDSSYPSLLPEAQEDYARA